MNTKIFIGSTLAVIIVLAGFSSIVSAQTTKTNTFFQQIKEKIKNKNLELGGIIDIIQLIMFWFIIVTTLFLSGNYG